jgi:FkbM family methyltransferase
LTHSVHEFENEPGDSIYPDARHPYYIVAPPYVQSSAGIRALHLLCHSLNRSGQVARMLISPTLPWREEHVAPDLTTPLLTPHVMRTHFERGQTPIMVYPEVVSGNPFGSPCVVRYVMNFPGLLGGDKEYSREELCFGYSQVLAAKTRFPDNILFLPATDTRIFRAPIEEPNRKGSCFYADKYKVVHKGELFNITKNSVEITRGLPHSQTPQEIANLFQHSELFYTYENTALAIEAVLCGCPAVFLPNPHLTEMIAIQELGPDGFAWGTDPKEIARAKATVKQGAKNYLKSYATFWRDLDHFIALTQKHAEGKTYRTPIHLPNGFGIEFATEVALRRETIHDIAREVWFERQRWGLPYKIGKWLKTHRASRNQSAASHSTEIQELDTKEATEGEVAHADRDKKEATPRMMVESFTNLGAAKGILVEYTGDGGLITVTKGRQRIILSAEHFIYAGDLCNQFDYYFSSTLPDTIDGMEVVDYSTPRWHVLRSGERIFYTSIAEDIGATRDYIDYLAPQEGEVVLDVGAYCGLSVLAFSRAVGRSGKVIAFEPDPRNYEALKMNLTQAGSSNVVVENKAVSGTAGTLLFSSEGNMGSAIVPVETERGTAIEVESTTLRDVVERHKLDQVGVIKLDIEGAEYGVIENSGDIIEKIGARWAVELHGDPLTGTPVNVDRIRSIFDRLGYLTVLQLGSETAAATTVFAFPRKQEQRSN